MSQTQDKKGYVALLGWVLNAIDAVDRMQDRRYIAVAPEWAGAINAVLLNNPRLLGQSMLFRDKALMKRRAPLGGIRVGIFEEAHARDDVIRFLRRVNQALLKLDGDPNDPIHLKAFDKAGCLGAYPRRRVVSELQIPPETEQDEYFEYHELKPPAEQTVTKRTAFGTHWGLAYFFGSDPIRMRELLKAQEDLDFYV